MKILLLSFLITNANAQMIKEQLLKTKAINSQDIYNELGLENANKRIDKQRGFILLPILTSQALKKSMITPILV